MLGAAAVQLGPEAVALIVILNKQLGLSHGEVATLLRERFGLIWNDLSRQLVLRLLQRAASMAVETAIATVDYSDIRRSRPHDRDPS